MLSQLSTSLVKGRSGSLLQVGACMQPSPGGPAWAALSILEGMHAYKLGLHPPSATVRERTVSHDPPVVKGPTHETRAVNTWVVQHHELLMVCNEFLKYETAVQTKAFNTRVTKCNFSDRAAAARVNMSFS